MRVTGSETDRVLYEGIARGAFSEERAGELRAWLEDGGDPAIIDAMPGGSIMASAPVQAGGQRVYRDVAAAPPAGGGPLYAANPLLEELRASKPALVSAAMQDGPPPELFGDSPLPRFTASGLDPQVLMSLPWPLRRPVAAAPTLAAAYQLVDQYAPPDGDSAGLLELRYRANADYVGAFSAWLVGPPGRASNQAPPEGPGVRASADPEDLAGRAAAQATADSADYVGEALYRELFGAP